MENSDSSNSTDGINMPRNEEDVGQILKECMLKYNLQRSDIFVITKLSPADHGEKSCAVAIDLSLRKLSLEFIDLYLIHWPGVKGLRLDDPSAAELRKESWLQMERYYREGKLKAIGISNYTVKHLQELLSYCTVKPAVLQVEYHPHLIQKDLFEFCKKNYIQLQAYSSLGTSSNNQLLVDPVVNDIASRLGQTAAQVLLKWSTQQKICVIPKASTAEHIKLNWNLWNFTISDQDVRKLDALDKQKHYCWDPHTVT